MKKLTTEQVINVITSTTNYDTSELTYEASNAKLKLICHEKDEKGKEHGYFFVTLGHLKNGHGCPKCGAKKRTEKRKKTVDNFVIEARQIHGWKYDYSKVEYKNAHTKVCIICPEHGEFWQTPASHLLKRGCPKCSKPHLKYTTEEFIEKARKVHGDKYDYSKVEYENASKKVKIICKKHGEFLQTPSEHLNGCGCKYCKESHLESDIRAALVKNKINFLYDVRDITWLKPLTFDFYLPDYSIAIECQGEQHFFPIEHFGGEENFKNTKKRDELKRKLCKENNVKLLEYSNYKYNNTILTNVEDIIKEINETKNR